MTHQDIARAFSGHRFEEALAHLADDVRWVLVGDRVVSGRAAVESLCSETTEGLADVTTSFPRFVSTGGDGAVAVVDAVGLYSGADGVTAVSSCDIYEFTGDLVTTITSYTVEVDPHEPGSPPPTSQPA